MSTRLLNSNEKKDNIASKHPLKRIGEPKDICKIATFLLSEDSSWITGQILRVDGVNQTCSKTWKTKGTHNIELSWKTTKVLPFLFYNFDRK